MKGKTRTIKEQSLLPQKFSSYSKDMANILAFMEKLLYWAAIIDSSDDAIISISEGGIITSWNRGAERLYGYLTDEIVEKPVSVLMPPQKKDDFPYIIQQLREGKRIEHYETERMTKDGRVINVSITVSPIKDSLGNIVGASKIARDITERVENQRRRDEFVSTASHELKTPLTSQKAFGEILEQVIDQRGYTDLKPYIQKINNQTDKLTKLIEDLLQLSRVQTGHLLMENKRFRLDQLITETVENTQMTTKHHIRIKGLKAVIIKGDRERIGQVLTNLMSNGIKYSPQADTLDVTMKTTKSTATVCVQDYGIGIDPEYYDKIFERFFRITGENEKTFPGMGIGLHVSNEIIKRHKGKLEVESVKGKGSKFCFTLPLPIHNKI